MSNTVNPRSIRQTIITALLAGEDRKAIAAKVQAIAPESAAAKKSVKHIAWYAASLRKAGKLPKAGAVVEAPAAE